MRCVTLQNGNLKWSTKQISDVAAMSLRARRAPSLVSQRRNLIHNRNRIEDRPTVQGRRDIELTLAFLTRDGLFTHRGLPGHDGHEDSSLPEVVNPDGIS